MKRSEEVLHRLLLRPEVAVQDGQVGNRPFALLGDEFVQRGIGIEVVTRIVGLVHYGPLQFEYTSRSIRRELYRYIRYNQTRYAHPKRIRRGVDAPRAIADGFGRDCGSGALLFFSGGGRCPTASAPPDRRVGLPPPATPPP